MCMYRLASKPKPKPVPPPKKLKPAPKKVQDQFPKNSDYWGDSISWG